MHVNNGSRGTLSRVTQTSFRFFYRFVGFVYAQLLTTSVQVACCRIQVAFKSHAAVVLRDMFTDVIKLPTYRVGDSGGFMFSMRKSFQEMGRCRAS